ncbi:MULTISPECIES: GNAT family protein [Acidiplasma]|jgi:RimJ/RimL family protein N-acetyltransferase|uniref:N-acetyltransferase domain-containing protein n=2 Tax=Acidiplasma aeolicum TaxID=507754 RepID=A0A0Q0RV05_9ARCH|nr:MULTISPECIES: GNAT family protein [Acidiplasma]KQB33808.1 hypothetical protein AOG54_01630 [Acidiplasma aeolicum]
MEKFEFFLDNNVFITNNFDINSLHDFVEMANEKDLGFNLMSHSFPYPYTEEDALFFIDQEREMGGEIFSLDLYIYFNGRIAGVIGLKDIDYLNNRAHIGYWIGKKYRNRGIATSAVGLVSNVAKTYFGMHTLYTKVLVNNIPSINVLLKNRFEISGIEKDAFFFKNIYYSAYIFNKILY